MKKNICSVLSLALIISLLGCDLSVTEMNLRIAYDRAHQEIDGFGASDAWSIDPTIGKWLSENDQAAIDRLADRLFSVDQGIGLSAWRFNIGAGSAEQGDASLIPDRMRRAQLLVANPGGAIDKNKQLGQIRMLQEAYERGVTQFVAFANSPPHWATKNGLTHPGDGTEIGSTNLDPERLDDFAEFLVDVVAYLRSDAVGVPVNYLSPINEPTWEWQGQSQEANRYNMDEVAAVYRQVAWALQKVGLGAEVEVDGPESVEYSAALGDAYMHEFDGTVYGGGMNGKGLGSYKNYVDELLGDAELRDILHNKISLHAYWSEASADRLGRLRDLLRENLRSVSPDAKLWMSEFCILGDGGDVRSFGGHGFEIDNLDYALHVARFIHRDLTRLDASAWFWWLALTPYDYKDGLLKIDPSLDAVSVQESKLMWTLGNFSRFVRPGYRRIELPDVDDLNGVMASAYKAPDDSRLVVIAINAGEATERISLDIVGLPGARTAGTIDVFVTDAAHDLTLTASETTSTNFTLLPRSTTTFLVHLAAGSKDTENQ